jgi:hypothetical protein
MTRDLEECRCCCEGGGDEDSGVKYFQEVGEFIATMLVIKGEWDLKKGLV